MQRDYAPAPPPQDITVHTASRVLELRYASGQTLRIPFELLRVYSPSAQVKGHGPGQEVLQTGKRDVLVTGMAPVGRYAIQPTFSDGHDSGIYTWDYLYFLGSRQQALWQEYEQRLAAAGAHRDDAMPETAGRSCGSH
ncbi:MAG: gamma-butyrobetaine hydroxylase-like domain-containing protein [Ottowia sp.]